MRETAFAKINLALHVRGRRDDGYHALETLFAFVDAGDELVVSPAAQDELITVGEFGTELTDPFDNIVAKALSTLSRPQGWAVTLDKQLPVAAGLGGGSADAGAIFRMVEREYGLPDDWMARAAKLGADVPACVKSLTCVGKGTGTKLKYIDNNLAGMPVLLVNPRIPLSTGPVFKGWDGVDRGPLPSGSVSEITFRGRNHLEQSALNLCPIISEMFRVLRQTSPRLYRMSGSGATCFALYKDDLALQIASDMVREEWGGWWQMSGHLR